MGHLDRRLGPSRDRRTLEKRGWVLQERLLSPRVLFFGANQLYFECRSDNYFECWWHGGVELDAYAYGVSSYIQKPNFEHAGLSHRSWREILKLYCGCDLSRPSDRLPALSGLAKRFARSFEDDVYLTGLWRNSFVKDMVWWLPDPPARCKNDIAPSWSWAKAGTVNLHVENSVETEADANLIFVDTTPAGQDVFSAVRSERAIIDARLRQMICVRKEPPENYLKYYLVDPFVTLAPMDSGPGGASQDDDDRYWWYFPDEKESAVESRLHDGAEAHVTCMFLQGMLPEDAAVRNPLYVLTLEPVASDPGTYRRTGLAKVEVEFMDADTAIQYYGEWLETEKSRITWI